MKTSTRPLPTRQGRVHWLVVALISCLTAIVVTLGALASSQPRPTLQPTASEAGDGGGAETISTTPAGSERDAPAFEPDANAAQDQSEPDNERAARDGEGSQESQTEDVALACVDDDRSPYREGVWSPQDGNALTLGILRLRPSDRDLSRPAPAPLAPAATPARVRPEDDAPGEPREPLDSALLGFRDRGAASPKAPRPKPPGPTPPGPVDGGPHGAPELSADSLTAGLLLLAAGLILVTGRKRRPA